MAAVLISGTTGNGNFETVTGAIGSQIMFSTGDVANWVSWTEYDSVNNDTGVISGADRRAFIQPGSPGGAFRSTISDTGTVGTVITYGFDYEGSGGNATMVLLYQDLSNAYVEITNSFLRSGAAAGGTVGTYSRTFTINSGDAWENRPITVAFRNSIGSDGGTTPTGQYPNIDNVVFSSVPEPSVTLLGSIGALALLRRRRK